MHQESPPETSAALLILISEGQHTRKVLVVVLVQQEPDGASAPWMQRVDATGSRIWKSLHTEDLKLAWSSFRETCVESIVTG